MVFPQTCLHVSSANIYDNFSPLPIRKKNKNFTQSNNLRKRPRGSNKFYKNCTQHKNAKTLCVRVNNSAKPINLLLAKSVSSTVSLARKTLSHTALQNPKFVNFFFCFFHRNLLQKGKSPQNLISIIARIETRVGGEESRSKIKTAFPLFFLREICLCRL